MHLMSCRRSNKSMFSFAFVLVCITHLVLCFWWYSSDWSSSGSLFVGGMVQTGPHLVLCFWWYSSDWSSSGSLLVVWFRLVLIWSSVCWWYSSDWSSSGSLFVGGMVQTGPHLVLCLLVVWFRLVIIWSSVGGVV